MATFFVASKFLYYFISLVYNSCLIILLKISDILPCYSCLYATTPPLCPLCRKQYQPGKIKKLHVDRPENVDEAREVELGRQQLELLEQLVKIWEVEMREGLDSNFNKEGESERSIVDRVHYEDGDDHELRSETEEEIHGMVSAGPVPGVHGTDVLIGGLLGLRGFDRNNDVEHILDGIAGAPGVGREFLQRWGSTLVTHGHEGSPIVTLREAQKVHATEVLRRVDVWLEGKDEDSVIEFWSLTVYFRSYSIIDCCSAEVSLFLCPTSRGASGSQGCPGICQIS